jgi:hypothetical protein
LRRITRTRAHAARPISPTIAKAKAMMTMRNITGRKRFLAPFSPSIDELLLHPREAAHFCDDVRRQYGYFDVPDDIILRVILTRGKNPAG